MVSIAKKKGEYINCEFCGVLTYKTPYQLKRNEHHFCSNKCQAKQKRLETFEYRSCEICGSKMYISKKSTQRFCSYACQSKWQRTNTRFNNKKFQGGYVICENCGNEFIVGKTVLGDNRHHFCSTKCRQAWYSDVWSQSKEWREESRIRAVDLLKSKPAITQTKPQIKVNELLDGLNLNYRNEENFIYYSIDNYLSDNNLAIEVMGDYWHGSPLRYPYQLNDRQRHVVARDKAKNTFIKNKFGINILYLWETDIHKRPEVCKKLITTYVKNSGILENYHSFNYELDNSTLHLSKELIVPYQQGRKEIAC